MRIKPRSVLCKNINQLQEHGYEVDDDNKPVTDNTPNQITRNTPTHTSLGDRMVLIV